MMEADIGMMQGGMMGGIVAEEAMLMNGGMGIGMGGIVA